MSSPADETLAKGIIEYLDTLKDEHAVRAWRAHGAVAVPIARWERDDPELAMTVKSAFVGHLDLLAAERGRRRTVSP